jgi:hypothetical protein
LIVKILSHKGAGVSSGTLNPGLDEHIAMVHPDVPVVEICEDLSVKDKQV